MQSLMGLPITKLVNYIRKNVMNPDWKMDYSFIINNGVVEKEELIVNGKMLIKRTKATAKYENQKINPPSEKLVVQIRRDQDLYQEIELLMLWAEGVISVSCSDINPFTILGIGKFINPYNFSELVDALSPDEMKKVLATAKELGYSIASIKTIEATKDVRLVQLKERSISNEMVDMQLSSGMLRTLYLLCFVSVIKHNKKLSMLLIDDMGEGLDYRRSIDLGKVIFEDCQQSGLQLVVSSNDAFLMDVVDISNWQILRRKGNKVSSINQAMNPDMFRKFRMTGLSNFIKSKGGRPEDVFKAAGVDYDSDFEETVYHPYNKVQKIYQAVNATYGKHEGDYRSFLASLTKEDYEVLRLSGRCASFRSFIDSLLSSVRC